MNAAVSNRCISALGRVRHQAPPMRAVMGVAPKPALPIGVPAFGGLVFGGMGPEAAP